MATVWCTAGQTAHLNTRPLLLLLLPLLRGLQHGQTVAVCITKPYQTQILIFMPAIGVMPLLLPLLRCAIAAAAWPPGRTLPYTRVRRYGYQHRPICCCCCWCAAVVTVSAVCTQVVSTVLKAAMGLPALLLAAANLHITCTSTENNTYINW
jgi:hypothetical protein